MASLDFFMSWNKSYNVIYDINPWMTNNIQLVNTEKAYDQWCSLVNKLENLGAKIGKLIIDNSQIPDIVFTANAGFKFNDKITLSKFKYKARQDEIIHYQNWFLSNVESKLYFINEDFEGAGDALYDVDKNLWVGYGFRSDNSSHEHLKQIYPTLNLISLKLINSKFYHLDTCFCPLSNGYLLYYPLAFTDEDNRKIKEKFQNKIVEVNDEDADLFSCNCVEWNNNLILNVCSFDLQTKLKNIGYNVHLLDFSEFLRAGGAAKCLTLKL